MALALAIFATLLGSTVPSPLYPVYIDAYGLKQSMATAIFAIYALGTLASLLLAPKALTLLPDARWIIIPGLLLTALGAMIFAISDSVHMLLLGRFLSGAGTGVIAGLASASLFELSPPEGRKVSAVVATVAFTGGAAAGPLLTSALLAVDFHPLVVPFLVIAGVAMLALAGLAFASWPDTCALQRSFKARTTEKHHQLTEIVQPSDMLFRLACLTVGVAWMLGSTLMALGASLSLQIYGVQSASLAGLVPSIFQLFAGLGQALWGRAPTLGAVLAGAIGLVFTQAALVAAAPGEHTDVLLALIPLCGFFYGAAFVGALALANASAPPHRRATFVARFYIVGYLSNALPTLGLGLLIDRIGLADAFVVFSAILVMLAALTSIWALCSIRVRRRERLAQT